MSTPTRSPEDEKEQPAIPPETFAALRAEIERLLTELEALGAGLKQNFERSISTVAVAVEDQIKQAVRAAEHVARTQTQLELRTKYGKEFEMAMAETALMERRLQIANKQFEEQKRNTAAKLEETEQALSKSQADYRQMADELRELQDKLQQAAEKLSASEQSLAEAQAQARQLSAEKIEIETRLQQSEDKRIEAQQSVKRLLADTGQAETGRKELETQLKEAQRRRSEVEEALIKLQAELKLTEAEASAAKGEFETRLKETSANLFETELALGKLRMDFNQLQGENQRLESKLGDAAAHRSDAEIRLREAAERFALAEESISSLRQETNRANAGRTELEAKLKEVTKSRAELEERSNQTEAARSQLEAQLRVDRDRCFFFEQEVQKLEAELRAAKAASAAAAPWQEITAPGLGSGLTTDSSKILEEVARSEVRLAEVLKLIDDPASALSTVMRKNVEKTEIEAYLRGIRFATGETESN